MKAFSLLLLATTLAAQGTLIPVADRRDHVWDAAHSVLWITRDNGSVQAWDPYAERLLPEIAVGIAPRGIDITGRGTSLYIADNATGPGRGHVRRLDVDTGMVTTLSFDLDRSEGGVWDIVLVGGGKALLTTAADNSALPVPVRELNLTTGVYRRRADVGINGLINQGSVFGRSVSRALVALAETRISQPRVFKYTAAGDSFASAVVTNGGFLQQVAVNPLNNRVAVTNGAGVFVLDEALTVVRTLSHSGGVGFAPGNGFLWVVEGDRVIAYDPTVWSVEANLAIGETVGPARVFGDGMMTISDDNAFLFVSTPSGLRMLRIGQPRPAPFAVTPSRAPHGQSGTAVTISGRFFGGPNLEVLFGAAPAVNVQVVDAQTITCTAPAGLPGPVDVVVRNALGAGTLQRGFRYTPATLLDGEARPGGHVAIDTLLDRGSSYVGFVGALASPGMRIGMFDGEFCLQAPIAFAVAVTWPFDELTVRLSIPDDPALRGQVAYFQGLVGAIADGTGAFTNCAAWAIQ